MALIKPGPAIADIRGSINGVTFSRNRAGMIARQRVVPTNPRSDAQTLVRDQLTYLQGYFRNSLTATEQAQWETAVATYPRTNKLGDSFKLTAINLFILVNFPLYTCGGTILTTPPAVPLAIGMPQPTIAGSTIADLEITITDPVLSAGDAYLVYVSPPLAQTRNYWQGPWDLTFRVLGAGTFPLVLKAMALLSVGQRYVIRTNYTSVAGKVAPPQYFTHDITA